jgi:hypothetical protein
MQVNRDIKAEPHHNTVHSRGHGFGSTLRLTVLPGVAAEAGAAASGYGCTVRAGLHGELPVLRRRPVPSKVRRSMHLTHPVCISFAQKKPQKQIGPEYAALCVPNVTA